MKNVGIRDLKAHASEIVQQVRESGERYVVTHRGRAVGVLAPLAIEPALGPANSTAAWDRWQRLTERVDAGWKAKQSSVAILSGMRR